VHGGARLEQPPEPQEGVLRHLRWRNLDAVSRLYLPFILRWDAGVYGLGDIGRIYLKDETSTKWHYSAGGGLWVAASDRSVVGRMELATGDDGIGFRFGTAFKF
jgi:hypothetical protein